MTYKKFKNIKYFTIIIFLAILNFLFVNSARSNVRLVIINDCELKNLCKRIDVEYKIYLPKDLLRENYYLINGLLNPDRVFYITDIQKPNNSYYSGAVNLLYGSILHYVYFMKKTDFEKIPIKYFPGHEYPRMAVNIFFIKSDDGTNCIAIDSETIRNILIKHNLRSIKDEKPIIDKIFGDGVISNEDYENLLSVLKKEGISLLPCNEFLNKLIKIKFAKPEDSDESVLTKLAQKLGVYSNYPLGYIPVMSPIRGLEIQYKADPEVKGGYIILTKIRETIYLDDGTKKEFKPSSITTTSTPSQSLLLNIWLKIKCFFLRLIGKAC